MGISQIRLLTNNPAKRHGLSAYGLEIVERVPVIAAANPHNAGYLATKQAKLGHLLDAPGRAARARVGPRPAKKAAKKAPRKAAKKPAQRSAARRTDA